MSLGACYAFGVLSYSRFTFNFLSSYNLKSQKVNNFKNINLSLSVLWLTVKKAMSLNKIEIGFVNVESNSNELKNKVEQLKVMLEQVEKLLDEIRNYDISISLELSEFSRPTQD